MAIRSQFANSVFNNLYPRVKGACGGQQNVSFELKVFNAGTAYINVSVVYGNASISLSFICVPIFDEANPQRVIKWRFEDDMQVVNCDTLDKCITYISQSVSRAKLNVSRIR